MTDIVERLREKIITDAFRDGEITSGALADRLIRERLDAADEIDRLQEENDGLLSTWAEIKALRDALRAENEWLQEGLKKRTSETSDWGEKQYVNGWNDALANAEVIIDLRAENEPLKREAEIRLDQLEREQEAHLKTMAELNKAAHEIERLREALKPFSDWEKEVLGSYHFDKMPDDKMMITTGDGRTDKWIYRQHLRAAKAALGESDE